MAKPFSLTFPYTPRWKGNRKRDSKDQFTVTLRDMQESQRVAQQERFVESMNAKEKDDDGRKREGADLVIVLTKDRLENAKEMVRKHLVSIENLVIEDTEGKEHAIDSFDLLWEYGSDVVAEIAARLLTGPDQDELKN